MPEQPELGVSSLFTQVQCLTLALWEIEKAGGGGQTGSVIASGGGKHFKENPVNRAMCSGDVKGNDCQRAVGRPWGMSLSAFHKEASVVRQEQKSGFRDEEVRQEEEGPPYTADREVDQKEDRSPGGEGRAGPHEGGEFSRTL